MDFAELLAEMVARGAENNPTRNGVWINLAYHEIVNSKDWPFTEAFETGAAGTGIVEVPLFRKAKFVGDVSSGDIPGRRLHKAKFEVLARDGVININDTGTPEYWWLQQNPTAIVGYPAGGTIFVHYTARVADLTGTNEPVFDPAYHYLIVDRAMVEVLKDNDEDDEAVKKLQLFERGLAKMAEEYGVDSIEHGYIEVIDPYDG